MTRSARVAIVLAVAAATTAPVSSQPHAMGGCPWDKGWIGGSCPRQHFRELVRGDGCCTGGGRQGLCPENCPGTANADGSCSCRMPCDPPQPAECAASGPPPPPPPPPPPCFHAEDTGCDHTDDPSTCGCSDYRRAGRPQFCSGNGADAACPTRNDPSAACQACMHCCSGLETAQIIQWCFHNSATTDDCPAPPPPPPPAAPLAPPTSSAETPSAAARPGSAAAALAAGAAGAAALWL